MNAAQAVIPRPPNLRLDRCREDQLRDFMGISKEVFDLFKDIIEHYAIYKLPCVAKSRQKPEEWNEFLNTVNDILPLDNEYVDNWHISTYFSILRRKTQLQRRWKNIRAESAPSLLSKKKVEYIGKSPPSRRIITSPEKDRQRDDQTLAENNIPLTQEDSPLPGRAQHIPSPSVSQTQVNYPAPCTTCGFLPPISPYHSKRLHKLFVNAEDLVPILNFIGILHDRHLLMVLNWPRADRIAFIDTLRPDQVKPGEKQRLIMLLTGPSSSSYVKSSVRPPNGFRREPQYTTPRPPPHVGQHLTSPESSGRPPNRSRRERQYDPIPKPPPDIERQLTSPDTPLSELMQAMTIRDEQQFDEILQSIDRLYGECDETSARDNQWWKQFFQKVYSEWPVMPLYREPGPEENNWAIKFYLRRKLSGGIRVSPEEASTSITRQVDTQHTTGPLSGRSPSPELDSPHNLHSGSNQAYPYPGITLSTCPAHHPPDYRLVCQRLQNLLESHGSEELLPAFITVGIKTDHALISLSQLAKENRIKYFKRQPDQPDLHLTDLQAFALRRILHQL